MEKVKSGLERWRAVAIVVGTCLLAAVGAFAHELQREVTIGRAVVIRLYYADGTAFAHERYEIFREDDDISYQVGRTDALGRVVFVPDRKGEWRVRVFSEEGHGVDFTIDTDEAGEAVGGAHPLVNWYARVALGVAVILGVFALLMLVAGRSSRRTGA